jgi:hypothetical protein
MRTHRTAHSGKQDERRSRGRQVCVCVRARAHVAGAGGDLCYGRIGERESSTAEARIECREND